MIRNYDHALLRRRALPIARKHAPGMVEVVQDEDMCYDDIFKKLTTYTTRTQKRILRDFYSGFPNGEQVAEGIYRMLHIPWRTARNIENKENQLKELFANHNKRLEDFKDVCPYIDDFLISSPLEYQDAAFAAHQAIDSVAHAESGICIYNFIDFEILYKLLRQKKDGIINPWEPLISVYEHGVLFDIDKYGIIISSSDDTKMRIFQ